MRNKLANKCFVTCTALVLLNASFRLTSAERTACKIPAQPGRPGRHGNPGTPGQGSCSDAVMCDDGYSIVLEEVGYETCQGQPSEGSCCCAQASDDDCKRVKWENDTYMDKLAASCIGKPRCTVPDTESPELPFCTGNTGNPKTQKISYSCIAEPVRFCTVKQFMQSDMIYLAYNAKEQNKAANCECTLRSTDDDLEVAWIFGSYQQDCTNAQLNISSSAGSYVWWCGSDVPDRKLKKLKGLHSPGMEGRELNLSIKNFYKSGPADAPERLWVAVKGDGGVDIKCGPVQSGPGDKARNTDKSMSPGEMSNSRIDLVAVIVVIVVVLVIAAIAILLTVVYLRWRRSTKQRMDSTQRETTVEYTYPNSDVADYDYTSISRQGSTYATINDLHIDRGNYSRISITSDEYNKSNMNSIDIKLDPTYSRLQSRDSYSRIKETPNKIDVISTDYSHPLTTDSSDDYNRTTDKVKAITPASADYSRIQGKNGQSHTDGKISYDSGDTVKFKNTYSLNSDNKGKEIQTEEVDLKEIPQPDAEKTVNVIPVNNRDLNVAAERGGPEIIAQDVTVPSLPLPRKLSTSSESSNSDDDEYSKSAAASNASVKVIDNNSGKGLRDGYETAVVSTNSKGTDGDVERANTKVISDGYETALPVAISGNDIQKTKFGILNDGYETAVGDDNKKHDAVKPNFKVVSDGYETAVGDNSKKHDAVKPNFKVVSDGYETAVGVNSKKHDAVTPNFKVVSDGYETAVGDNSKKHDAVKPNFKVVSDGYETAVGDNSKKHDAVTPNFKVVSDGYETAVGVNSKKHDAVKPNFKVVSDGYETAVPVNNE